MKFESEPQTRIISLKQIFDGKYYIRSSEDLEPLKASIKSVGLRKSPTVTPSGKNRFMIVSGHRRIHALRELGWKEVRAFVKVGKRSDLAIEAIIENVMSKSYNGIEEARSFELCLKECAMSTRQFERLSGIDQSTIVHTLTLLELDERVQKMIEDGTLNKALGLELTAVHKSNQLILAKQLVSETREVARTYKKIWIQFSNKTKAAIEEAKIQPNQIVTVANVLGNEGVERAVLSHAKGNLDLNLVLRTLELIPPEKAKILISDAVKGKLDLKKILGAVENETTVALKKNLKETRDYDTFHALLANEPQLALSMEDPMVGIESLSDGDAQATRERLLETPPTTAQLALAEEEQESKITLNIPGLGHMLTLGHEAAFRNLIQSFNITCRKCGKSKWQGSLSKEDIPKLLQTIAQLQTRLEELKDAA